MMIYNKLFDSEEMLSAVALGTMTFGEQCDEQEAFKVLDYAYSAGINFIDTAEMYPIYPSQITYGATERIIGRYLKKTRNKFFIATKVASSNPVGIGATRLKWIRGGVESGGLSYTFDNFKAAVTGSLRRLGVDQIDLIQLHWPERRVPISGSPDYEPDFAHDKFVPFLNVLESIDRLRTAGYIRYFGLSNETAWGLMNFISLARLNGFAPPVCIQNPYNLLNRIFDVSLSEISLRENCNLISYAPLASGRLTGKYSLDTHDPGSRYKLWPGTSGKYLSSKISQAIRAYHDVANRHGLPLSAMAISFIFTRPFVKSIILGARNKAQLAEILGNISFALPQEVISDIDSVHKEYPNVGY